MGIIDDGIAFAHERFRAGLQTRVEYWWLQDGVWQGPGTIWPGRELNKLQINTILQNCTRAGVVDEDEVYRQAGLIDFRRHGHKSAACRIAHGTHVMDLACGYDAQNPPDDRPIVCVQLPIRVTAETSGARLFPFVHHAMRYILRRARDIGGVAHLPVVINLSYGNFAGPHDGRARLEEAMEELVQNSAKHGVTLRIVLPAGNSYLLRTHAQVSFKNTTDVADLEWRILPDGRKPSYLEIWLPPGGSGPSRLEATITSPTGQALTVHEGDPLPPKTWVNATGDVYGQVHYHYHPASSRGMFLVAVNETTSLDRNAAVAPAGTWIVQLQNQALGASDIVDAWIQRDDSLYGFPIRGRQSYFANDCYARFDPEGRDNEEDDPTCIVRRYSTINAIATGLSPIVMGGFLRKEMVPSEYSSAGPVTNPYRPDALTVSDDSRVHTGVLAAGSRSGSVVAMGGTSVAAPQIAKLIANELAAGGSGDRTFVQAYATAKEPGYPPPQPSLARGGAGRILLPPMIPLSR
jgi:hypothetical protein